ncbi:MAG: ribonuclease Z [Lachnospiraceae bacterium]|nr:ribonuclease Z [Lachnospiraceae bacterium]MDD5852702.1 ribonuclease Z [Lachnospiraceae bacterium]
MLDVCLLGTGGMMPLPYRYLTSMMARYNGQSILIDCGEGTQIAMKEKGWSPKPIDIMCFTHYHADHISGLPGMLLTMGNAERTSPLLMIGPKGLERVVNSLRVIAPELPFPIVFKEITQEEERFQFDGFHIDAFKVCHNVICYGYRISVERNGKFQVDRAKEQNIPVACWNRLQHGESVEYEGCFYTPDMVMGEDRRGISVTYCTDTRPTPLIEKYAADADLLILEGMYGEREKLAKAKEHRHMMFEEAAMIAAKADPKGLWLTHYSPSLTHPEEYMKDVKKIFPRAHAARDGKTVELCFEEE